MICRKLRTLSIKTINSPLRLQRIIKKGMIAQTFVEPQVRDRSVAVHFWKPLQICAHASRTAWNPCDGLRSPCEDYICLFGLEVMVRQMRGESSAESASIFTALDLLARHLYLLLCVYTSPSNRLSQRQPKRTLRRKARANQVFCARRNNHCGGGQPTRGAANERKSEEQITLNFNVHRGETALYRPVRNVA